MKKSVNQLIEFFRPAGYMLNLNARPKKREFSGQLFIHGNKIGEFVRLHSKGLKITNAKVNYVDAKIVELENDEIELKPIKNQELPPERVADYSEMWNEKCDTAIALEFTGEINPTDMHGLYECHYEENGAQKIMLATQFESHHAREVFPCVDEPAAKAKFQLAINTDPEFTVLSNMPIEREILVNDSADGGIIVKDSENPKLEQKPPKDLTKFTGKSAFFQITPKMSSYLLAFAIGDLQKFSAKTENNIEVNIFATKAQTRESLKFAAEVATRAIDFYEEYFGIKYPLSKSDHIALPDFSSGAMENWGLITYRETELLADKNTALSRKQRIATVITHELAHQWFGNLTTMKWWNNLWLNESFASLMENISVNALYPEWKIWEKFETNDVIFALRRDALSGVQSVQQDVYHPDEISTLFDSAIVYAKGERLLKMLREYLGEEIFRAGLQNYFKKFAYKNTVADDLWNSLTEILQNSPNKNLQINISELMTPWLIQSGYPIVSAELLSSGEIELTQKRFLMNGETDETIWPIPLFSNDKNCPDILSEKSAKFKPNNLAEFRLNIGDNAHFIAKISDELQNKSNVKLADLPIIDKVATLNQTSLLARNGTLSAIDEINVLQNLSNESSSAVWDVMAILISDVKKIIENDEFTMNNLKKIVKNIASDLMEKLGIEARETDDNNVIKLRAIILAENIFAEDNDEIANHPSIDAALKIYHNNENNLQQIDGELREIILSAAVKFGTQKDFEYLLNIYKNTSSASLRQDISASLTSARKETQIEQLLNLLTDTNFVRPQDLFYWFSSLMANRFSREKTWFWLQQNWSFIEKTFGGDKSFDIFPRIAGNILRTREELEQFQKFFAKLRNEPSLTRTIELGEKDISARIKWIDRDFAAITKQLENIVHSNNL